MALDAKGKSLIYSTGLFATCLFFLALAGVTANGILSPFVAGEEWATERPLARGMRALTVVVGEYDQSRVDRVADAVVVVRRATLDGPVFVVRGATGPDGRASFELPPGPYFVEVSHAGKHDQEGVQLESSERLGAYFSESGVHWRRVSHESLERHGDVATLRVIVSDEQWCRPEGGGTYCAAIPEPGARVDVFREGNLVATTYTGHQNAMELPVSSYELRIELSGRIVEAQVALVCDTSIAVRFDADGGDAAREGCSRGAVGVPG